MILSRYSLERLAESELFVRDTLEKVCRLMEVLRFVSSNERLSNFLALKGGTAINLTIFHLPRLSVDIDYDFCGDFGLTETMEIRRVINRTLIDFMDGNGYCLGQKSRSSRTLDSLIFEYVNLGGAKDNLKLDINYSERLHILPPSKRLAKVAWTADSVEVLCVDRIEIFATKISALLSRSAARDLFDVLNLKKSGIFSQNDFEFLNRSVAFYTAVSGKADLSLDEYSFENIEKLTQHRIKTDLVPVIHRGVFFDLASARGEVYEFLRSFLKITPEVRAFFDAFLSGEYKPELLFPENDIGKNLLNHPMALWRIKEFQKR